MEMYITYFWSLMGAVSLFRSMVPHSWVDIAYEWLNSLLGNRWSNFHYYKVPESFGNSYEDNSLYRKVRDYVGTLRAVVDTDYAILYNKDNEGNQVLVSLDNGQSVEDEFEGVKVWWSHTVEDRPATPNNTTTACSRSFLLRMHKADKLKTTVGKGKVPFLQAYLEHIQVTAEETCHNKGEIKIFANNPYSYDAFNKWTPVVFKHPSTFETIALDPSLKDSIISDLDSFVKGKEYYHSLGRAWKRGYLFYGPPGTGKSSMIAAMANYLHYNVYDMELTSVSDNRELRILLTHATNKSIIVIEDIDCSLDLTNRADGSVSISGEEVKETGNDDPSKVTLSGMLNFIDGLWSCCGEERIIVFTTNHKDKLDPALLRPGRMDMHVYFPYCSFSAFKELASTYLGITEHPRFGEVDDAFGMEGANLTPAQVGEILLFNKKNTDTALTALVHALRESASSTDTNS